MDRRTLFGAVLCLYLLSGIGAVRAGAETKAMALRRKSGWTMWKLCNPFAKNKIKGYQFEFLVNGSHMAMQLILDQANPRIDVYSSAAWSVSLTGTASKEKRCNELMRNVTNASQNIREIVQYESERQGEVRFNILSDTSEKPRVINLTDIKYLEFKPVAVDKTSGKMTSPDTLEIQVDEGTKELIAAGIYVPVTVMRDSLLSLCDKPDELQRLAGTVGGGVAAAIGGKAGEGVAVDFTAPASIKLKREAGMTPARKIFEKLRCHPRFGTCGKLLHSNRDILVPVGRPCPKKLF